MFFFHFIGKWARSEWEFFVGKRPYLGIFEENTVKIFFQRSKFNRIKKKENWAIVTKHDSMRLKKITLKLTFLQRFSSFFKILHFDFLNLKWE